MQTWQKAALTPMSPDRDARAEPGLVGTWRLVGIERPGSDPSQDPFGPSPMGYIIYTPEGYMAADFMGSGRSPFGGSPAGAADEIVAAAARGYHSYCGRYQTRGDSVIHQVEVSLLPHEVGTTKIRQFEVNGDVLVLTVIADGGGVDPPRPLASLRWRRSCAQHK